jgi:pimeloyl-ACP methyl ester carboxylesterase
MIPAASFVLVFVLYPLTIAVNATNRPPTPIGATTPADLGLSYRNASFQTADGVALSAWYVPSSSGSAVVLLHGSGSTRSSVLDHAVVLARHGYGVLLLDTRGHGLSGGHAMDFGWYGDLDIAAAVSYLQARPDVRQGRIAAVGMSMGGEQAIAAAGSDPRIAAVVAEGVTGMQPADHGWLPNGFDGWVQRRIDRITYGSAAWMSGAHPPMRLQDAISASAPRPLLLIAASTVPDEAVAARYFRRASPGSVTLWVVRGAGHTGGLRTQPATWEARVTGFLDRALGNGGTG